MKKIIHLIFIILFILFVFEVCGPVPKSKSEKQKKSPILFASYAEHPQQVSKCLVLCKSIRTFAGAIKDAPIRVYLADQVQELGKKFRDQFRALSVELRNLEIPNEAQRFFLAGKPYAAAQAETDAYESAEIVAFLDANIIILQEPHAFRLDEAQNFAYRPVMHQNIGSLYSEPLDAFWGRLYEILKVPESSLFPMEGVADKKIIRPYFNAGYLVVRPERGIFRNWIKSFEACYSDPKLVEMCAQDQYNIFLHQAALAGSVLTFLRPEEMIELPSSHNVPLFFEKFYDSETEFNSLENITSIKYEFNFSDLPEGWEKYIKGPADVIGWLKTHCTT